MISDTDKYPIFSIITLVLIVSANYIGPIFPCKVQDLFSDNIYFKHILGFFTMLFFVILTVPNQNLSIEESFKQSAILYFWFMLMAKTPKYIFLFLCILLLLAYVLTLKKNHILSTVADEKINDTDNTENDKALVESKKSVIHINKYISHLYDLFIILTIIGLYIYYGKKKKEYKSRFNHFKFLLGNPNCRHDTNS